MISPGRAAQSSLLSPVLTLAEERVLTPFLFYHILTPKHICRLFYSEHSLTFAYTVLAHLAGKDFLQVIKYHSSLHGRSQYVYTLARRGLNWLASEGYEVPQRYHAGELSSLSRQHLDHTLGVNHLFIGLELLEQATPTLRVATRIHERTLKKQGTRVEVSLAGDRKPVTVPVIFDGWTDLRLPTSDARTERRSCFGLELERSVKTKHRWAEKVAALVAWSKQGYRQQFGTGSLTVAVFTTLGDNHRRNLTVLAEQTLKGLGQEQEAGMFRFAALPPAEDPRRVWQAPVWYQPFVTQPMPLLPEVN
jgi:Replication-relaxation